MQELYNALLNDLKSIGIRTDFSLVLKPYSKTLYGKYNPNTQTVVLYVYKDINFTQLYPYRNLLLTAIHECIHHIQWSDCEFVRLKGVMHNAEFYSLFNKYKDRALALLLLREVIYCDSISERSYAKAL